MSPWMIVLLTIGVVSVGLTVRDIARDRSRRRRPAPDEMGLGVTVSVDGHQTNTSAGDCNIVGVAAETRYATQHEVIGE